jgi:hypothetical protein
LSDQVPETRQQEVAALDVDAHFATSIWPFCITNDIE